MVETIVSDYAAASDAMSDLGRFEETEPGNSRRVRRKSTETQLVVRHTDNYKNGISLYSPRDESWRELPRYPKTRKGQKGIPSDCQCVSLDGRVYVLGGKFEFGDSDEEEEEDDGGSEGSDKRDGVDSANKKEDGDDTLSSAIYVLDLAGPEGLKSSWTECASMPRPRYDFACGVMGGKIYVFGGLTTGGKPTRSSLVYDPETNAWSSFKPMKHLRQGDIQAVSCGEEFYLHGKCQPQGTLRGTMVLEVYHTGRDEWRLVESSGELKSSLLFSAKGKRYMVSSDGIYGHHVGFGGKYSWEREHTFTFLDEDDDDAYDVLGGSDFDVMGIVAVHDELIGITSVSDARESQGGLSGTRGFGGYKAEMLWTFLPNGDYMEQFEFLLSICPIQL